MNQFRLDLDATRCAQAHQDAHCGKMLLELTQQLCTGFPVPDYVVYRHLTWSDATPEQRIAADLLPYANTHRNHPCAVWTRATRANFDNTIELAQALAVEYRYRKDKSHGSEAALDWVVRHQAEAQVPDGPLQPFVLAMPEEYQYREQDTKYLIEVATGTVLDPCVAAYRVYYRAEKRGYWRKSRDPAKPSVWVPAKWTKRDPPEWFLMETISCPTCKTEENVCCGCGAEIPDANENYLAPDPYASEIAGVDDLHLQCDRCIRQSADDI